MKQSELLRKQADMIDLAEKHDINDWSELIWVRDYERECWWHPGRFLTDYSQHKFALGVVEGKPVFEGDVLYSISNGRKVTVLSTWTEMDAALWTWNPPKPKTVMIELPINMATYYAELQNQDISVMREACRKALESINQS